MAPRPHPLPVLDGQPYPPDLLDHLRQRLDGWTDAEIRQTKQLADEALEQAIDRCQGHSVAYLIDLGLQGHACKLELEERAQAGYWRRRAAEQRFDRQILDEIKRRVSLVDEIGRKHRLRKSGRRFVTNCPFHQPDRTPSFTIYPETVSYYCFGCQVSGDIFDWVRHERNLSFPDAVRALAGQCGVRLPEQRPASPGAPASGKRRIAHHGQGAPPARCGGNASDTKRKVVAA